jgi:CRP-like cAMP-binding protein
MSASMPATSSNVIPLNPHLRQQRFLARGEFVALPTESLWRLERGFARSITWHYEGQVATLGLWGPGDLLGIKLLQLEGCQLECLTPIVLSEMQLGQLPSSALQEATTCHLVQSQTLLNILHYRPMPLRLLKLLFWLAQRFGHEVERGWVLDLRLTHQALAESIGTTRVTVTRMLQSFEKEGRVRRLHHRHYFLQGLAAEDAARL